jgi:hypothetical protein
MCELWKMSAMSSQAQAERAWRNKIYGVDLNI